jgi:biuret amidohydrolase
VPIEDALADLDPASTALVVVDMQNDFCHPEGFYHSIGRPSEPIRGAIPPIVRLLEAARRAGLIIVFTRLVHDPNQPEITERHRLAPGGWASRDRRLLPGSWGADVVDELAPRPSEYVIDKADYSAFYGTNLEAILRRRGVRSLILTGTVTYACVLHTAFDAFVRDFDIIVVTEGVSGWLGDLQEPTFRIVELLLGRVAPIEAILAFLAAPSGAGPRQEPARA